jgi:hypothetical protein
MRAENGKKIPRVQIKELTEKADSIRGAFEKRRKVAQRAILGAPPLLTKMSKKIHK